MCGFCLKTQQGSSDPSLSESLSSRRVQKKPLQTTEQPAALGRKLLPIGKSGNSLPMIPARNDQSESIDINGKGQGKKTASPPKMVKRK